MTINGVVLTSPMLANLPGIRHGFFTRQGGVSTGIYAGLNCGLGSSDDRGLVTVNRDRVAGHLGADAGHVVTVHQCHGTLALIVDQPFGAGLLPKADAVVTRTPGIVVAALAADCTPVLFGDPKAKVVAAAHAGWRGAVTGILESTIVAMEELGANRQDIHAAIGPCIHQQNYEVGPEFQAQFLDSAPDNTRFFTVPPNKAKAHFDLPRFVADQLATARISNITHSSHCTYGNPELFFSYRRATHLGEPDYGRQISAIVVT